MGMLTKISTSRIHQNLKISWGRANLNGRNVCDIIGPVEFLLGSFLTHRYAYDLLDVQPQRAIGRG